MFLKPIPYISPEERAALLPKVGDKVNLVGTSRVFVVKQVGMRWYILNALDNGEEYMALKQDVTKWVPPPPPPAPDPLFPRDSLEDRDQEFNDERLDTRR